MSVEDVFTDHVRILRRPETAGEDPLGHPVDVFEPVVEFWCQLFRSGFRAARKAEGLLDVSPFSAMIPPWVEIQIANDRLEVISSESFSAGKLFRFLDVGSPGFGAEYLEATLSEEF